MEEGENKSASLENNVDFVEEGQPSEIEKPTIVVQEEKDSENKLNLESTILSTEKEVASVLLRLVNSDSKENVTSSKVSSVIIVFLFSHGLE